MHMADALINVAVGTTMNAVSAGGLGYAVKKGTVTIEDNKVPLMGVMGAFVFAAQMINFTIPATGSSGHLGGGIMLAMLLGPHAAFITIAAVLAVQALFFGDGGLLALGCNIFNLGFLTCYVAYPLFVKPLLRRTVTRKRLMIGAMIGAVLGLQMGAFAVVIQTQLSGITALSFGSFALLMQPIHLAIGVVEGLITAAVVTTVYEARPELLNLQVPVEKKARASAKKVLLAIMMSAILIGGGLSLFASEYPDGLEWAIEKVTGGEELDTKATIHQNLEKVQETTAILPDYNLKDSESRAGGSFAGVVGVSITLGIILLAGGMIKLLQNRAKSKIIT